MGNLLRRMRFWIWRRQGHADLIEELEFHREMKQRELERDGLSNTEAVFAVRRAMGNVTLAREDARAVWVWPWLESVWQDVLYAVRGLRRQPGVTLVSVVTLVCAIGLNTSLFNVFRAIWLRPWPVADPDRVVQMFNMSPSGVATRAGGQPYGFSRAELRYFTEHAKTVTDFVAFRNTSDGGTVGLPRRSSPDYARAAADEDDIRTSWVSGNYFRAFGIRLALGRGFALDEDSLEAPVPVAVLSYGHWQRRFGGDPAIVGKDIRLDEVAFTVVGVTARTFTGTDPDRIDVWISFAAVTLIRPDNLRVNDVLRKPENCCTSAARAWCVARAGERRADGAASPVPGRIATVRPHFAHPHVIHRSEERPRSDIRPDACGRVAHPVARVRQRRQSAVGTGGGAAPGDRRSTLARRQPGAHRTPVVDRMLCAGGARRRAGGRHGDLAAELDHQCGTPETRCSSACGFCRYRWL